MSTRRLLFFPLPEYGHVAPTLEIARHYVQAGCEVIYLTAPHLKPLVASIGAGIEPLVQLPASAQLSGQRVWQEFTQDNLPGARRGKVIARLLAFLADSPCDLILFDHHLAISYGCDFRTALPHQPYLYVSVSLLDWDGSYTNLDEPLLVICPAELEVPRFRDRGFRVTYVEPGIPPRNFEISSLKSDRPLVAVTWGTQSVRYARLPSLYRMLDELANLNPGIDFVVQQAHYLDGSPSGAPAEKSSPPNLRRQLQVEPQSCFGASVRITHGGLSSTKEAILVGVPQIVLPFITDQPCNAMRVAYHRLGSALFPEEQTTLALHTHLSAALDGQFHRPIQQMRSTFLDYEAAVPSHSIIDARLP